MRNITVKGIRKSFDGRTVLDGVNFTFSEDSRLALVGENGSGKSTLLKIVTGKLTPDHGELFGERHDCKLIAQDFSGKDDETPREFLMRRVREIHKAIKLLSQSGFSLGDNESRLDTILCGDLSGGEKKKLEIVAGFSSNSMFIAMDEPENHLDYQSIAWLIGVVSRFHGGVVFVSHDQYFIDQLANSILELEEGTITVYTMRYEDYLAEKERHIGGQARDWVVEDKTIKRLRRTVEEMKRRAAAISKTAATYRQAKRRLEERIEQHGKRPDSEKEKPKVKISDVEQKQGKLIASVDHLTFAYGDKRIFNDASAELRFGDKVALFGPNGSGKSTLIKLITGELIPQNGKTRIGVEIKWQFMTQDHLHGVDRSISALEQFQKILKWPETRSRAILARYGINVDLVTRPLEVLSGGQQARFKLALIFAQEPEFLILDEPTNHVDPLTWEAIVQAVKEYSGTVLAVTHDREFIDAIAEKLWVIRDRKVFVELGNLSDYLERRMG